MLSRVSNGHVINTDNIILIYIWSYNKICSKMFISISSLATKFE